MKRIFSTIVTILFGISGTAQLSPQIPQIGTDIPNYIPPSPSVAALMKFEEVPVSNYTGIPDVSIPLFGTQTASPELNLSLSLSYHPSSIAVEEVAGFCGLGWSLNAGGSISRTVRGLPDEILEYPSTTRGGRIGIHQHINPYYQVREKLGTVLTEAEKEMIDEYAWSGQEKGKWDMEHDLYQFNFFGHTGRFILKRIPNNTDLEVVRLDNDNAVKIDYDNATKRFTAYDPNGFKYLFEAIETTIQSSATDTRQQNDVVVQSLSESTSFVSAYHLTSVLIGSTPIITYNYNTNSMPENTRTFSHTTNTMDDTAFVNFLSMNYGAENISRLEPKSSEVVNLSSISTKKIQEIIVHGKGKIQFHYEMGREDDKIGANAYKLKLIEVKTSSNSLVKKIELGYEYRENLRKRLFLKNLTIWNDLQTQNEKYNFEYATPVSSVNLRTDYWGFLNVYHSSLANGLSRETDPVACISDVLQKMTLPTGGAIIYDYESNTYSHIGSQPLANFEANRDNWSYESQILSFTSSGGPTVPQYIAAYGKKRFVTFTPTSNSANGQTGVFTLFKSENGNLVSVSGVNCGSNDGQCTTSEIELLPNVEYAIRYNWLNLGTVGHGSIVVNYKNIKPNEKQFLYGGGVRIKTIGFFEDSNVSANYYNFPQPQFDKLREKKYDYSFHNNPFKSSGSLVFAKPIFDWNKQRKVHVVVRDPENGRIIYETVIDYQIKSQTSYNSLSPIRTKGSDVGYQNVKVTESGNGYTKHIYTSPIDFPEESYHYSDFQVIPAPNLDYKRGLLKQDEIFNEQNQPLTKNTYSYEISEDIQLTGMRTIIGVNCPYSYLYTNYGGYRANFVNYPIEGNYGTNIRNCGPAITYIGFGEVREAYGWTRLREKISYSYLTQTPVSTKEEFTYNNTNKLVSTITSTLSTNPNQVILRQFDYVSNAINDISRIQKVQEWKNNEKIDEASLVYSAFTGNRLYPSLVYSHKGQQIPELKLRYTAYDTYGHPLEVQQENGIKISYIYGYNQTEPVAKIENMAYASIPQYLITAIHSAANETAMTTALDNLRNTLSNSMVTTYTYKPLVGVTSITDPKGDKITYEYDSFGRLKAVRDKDNNLLSENEYKYRTQN